MPLGKTRTRCGVREMGASLERRAQAATASSQFPAASALRATMRRTCRLPPRKRSATNGVRIAPGAVFLIGTTPLRRLAGGVGGGVGQPAGEFGHVVENRLIARHAGGRRAKLYDEVADLGLRHGRLHHVPARPAVAGVVAEDLAAPL